MSEKRHRRVLIVDDESPIAWALAHLMKLEGMDVSAYRNPLHLLEFASTNAPDLVISDVSMPEMTGIELARELMYRHPSCKIILFSGQPDTSALEKWAQAQQTKIRVFLKPLSIVELLKEVRQLVETAVPLTPL